MTSSNRSAILTKVLKVLKKHYSPVSPPADRPLLEHLLYACCLENAKYEQADEAFAKLQESYFDWNEIRVTTVGELSEVLASLPDPQAAAMRLKRTLQNIFETHYAFDLELLKKQNIGKATAELEKYRGPTPFAIAYVTQLALGGHAIALSQGSLDVLVLLKAASPEEAKRQRVPGLERAIPKNKGIEFASLLHQFGADYAHSPFSARLRSIVAEIDPEAKERLPRRTRKEAEQARAAAIEQAARSRKRRARRDAAEAAAEGPPPAKPVKKELRKPVEKPAEKTPAKAADKPPAEKPAEKVPDRSAGSKKKTAASKGLSKKKPR